ncbi:hypothetical protein [Paragemmobacter ruber]|uniref:Uncharacterized protein n=1 Tax=Paragemmobacter ruber TaxID=1985673 RepID=A0ABW9Y6X0_9RHOB|nr:hypothetical protein [Rhodobacter ruber]NBE08325.1 hypothetical protein [Rhodobacter ruber]
MIDGRFDPQFAHLFVLRRPDDGRGVAGPSQRPLLMICLGAVAVFAFALWLG